MPRQVNYCLVLNIIPRVIQFTFEISIAFRKLLSWLLEKRNGKQYS